MRFRQYITLITALLTITGFLALTLVEELGDPELLVIGAVTAVSLAINAFKRINIAHSVWNVLAITALSLFFVDYLFISKNLVAAGTHVTSALIIFKLFDLRTQRDFALFGIIVFLEILAAAASTASPLFFGLLAVFVLTSIWAMTVFNVKSEYEAMSGGKEPPPGIFGTSFLATTAVVTVASMLITMALFFIIPRMAIGFFETKTLNTIKVVGFSDVVDLGSFGEAKMSSAVVMRVEPQDAQGKKENFYMRGAVLDTFDGKRWIRSKREKVFVRSTQTGLFMSGRKRKSFLSAHKILLEPIETDVLFVQDGWSMINGRFRTLLTDNSGNLYLSAPSYSKTEYTVHSYATGHDVETDASALKPYLELPTEDAAPWLAKIKTLTTNIIQSKNNDSERALAIEDFLSKNYAYTLNPPRTQGITPLEDFLFYSKQGYCEHYATAMAVMLRTMGIPSRVVTGFINGEYSDVGKYYIIRQSDAHSWVEAYIQGIGWTRFDPTPASGTTTQTKTSSFVLYVDSLTWHWNRYVINFTLNDQIRLAVTTETTAEGIRVKIKNFLASPFGGRKDGITGARKYLPHAIALVIIAAIISLVIVLRKSSGRSFKPPLFYKLTIKKLHQKGFIRIPGETPMELAARSGLDAAEELTKAYYGLRYGGITPDKTEEERLIELAEKL